ncbi:MAG: hypothetical protein MPF33_05395 [Candidatus Aramenus sp.]|nr:hypothetical protein [Candidatus Aramenus sp.]
MEWKYLALPALLVSLVVGLLLASYALPYLQNPAIKVVNSYLSDNSLILEVEVSTPLALGAHYYFYVIGLRVFNKTVRFSSPPSFFNFGGNTQTYAVRLPLPGSLAGELDGINAVKVEVMFKVRVESSVNTYVTKCFNVSASLTGNTY